MINTEAIRPWPLGERLTIGLTLPKQRQSPGHEVKLTRRVWSGDARRGCAHSRCMRGGACCASMCAARRPVWLTQATSEVFELGDCRVAELGFNWKEDSAGKPARRVYQSVVLSKRASYQTNASYQANRASYQTNASYQTVQSSRPRVLANRASTINATGTLPQRRFVDGCPPHTLLNIE